MKLVCISDLHGNLIDNVPECDVLIIAGDICPATCHTTQFQKDWLRDNFKPWVHSQPAEMICAVPGNHDFIFEQYLKKVPMMGVHWLIGTGFMYGGLLFYGHPYTPKFCDWAFMPDRERLIEINDSIPAETDVLVTHGPPSGLLDTVVGVDTITEDKFIVPEHLGCWELKRQYIEDRISPKLHVFGHIHSSHGELNWKKTKFVNASVLGEGYTIDYTPIEVTLEG